MGKINLISISYFLNGFFPTVLMFIFFLNSENIKASEIAILSSLVVVLLNIFSSNKRNLILSSNNEKLFYETLFFRIVFFFPIFFLYLSYLYYFNLLNLFNILFFCLLFSLWINELLLVNHENNENKKKIYFNILVFIFYFCLIQLQFLLDLNFYLNFTNILLIVFLLFPLFSIFFKLDKSFLKININLFKQSIINNIFSLSFLSSFSFLLSVFVWRFFLIEFIEKEVVIYYFIIFAIASFPGTFINNFLGVSILKKNSKEFKKYFLILIVGIFTMFITFNYAEIKVLYEYQIYSSNIFLLLFNFSIIGSLIMSVGMYFRVRMFFLKNKTKTLFISDFFYGLIIAFIIPIFCLYFINYIYLSFFIGSLFSLIYYFSIYKISTSLINE